MLKYKYYKHHIISIAAFIICGISCDLFLKYYEEMKEFSFLLILSNILLFSLIR